MRTGARTSPLVSRPPPSTSVPKVPSRYSGSPDATPRANRTTIRRERKIASAFTASRLVLPRRRSTLFGTRVAESSPVRSWLAPSAVAACTGALAAGLVEGVATPYPIATTSLFALVTIPALMVLAIGCRGLVAAWQPSTLAARLAEDDESMPRLAGWLVTIWLGALFMAWATFQVTWQLAALTAFKPLAVGFILPVVAVGTFLIVAALSRPLVTAIAAIARRIDRRWRRHGRRTLLSSRVILGAATLGAIASAYILWRFVVRRRVVGFDATVFHAPLVAIAVTWIVHIAWPVLRRARTAITAVAFGLAVSAIGIAIVTAMTRPSVALEIWGARPISGVAVTLFGLERLRDEVPLAELAPLPRLGAKHPDIVLVTIETLRADQTPSYAGTADMPVMRELGKRGAVFSYAFAPSNETARSIPSMLTGTAPNRITDDPRHVTVAERLRAGGYETAGFVCCAFERRWMRGLEHLTIEPDGARLAEAANTWLADRRKRGDTRPLFLWVHLGEPTAWQPLLGKRNDYSERLRLYQLAIVSADRALARVLAGFAGRPPLVIVTSDHGEGLGDHDQVHHGTDLYNSQIRVPFVIAGPGIQPGSIAETVSGTDLAPTLIDLAGFIPPAGADGRSLADLARGTRLSLFGGGSAFAIGEQTAIVQGRWKLIEVGPMYELYDVISDPFEKSNHVTVRPDLVVELRKVLDLRQAAGKRSPFP